MNTIGLFKRAIFKFKELPSEEMEERSRYFLEFLKMRRTIRDFSPRPVSRNIIENCINAANTAPSGANSQPWHFALVESAEVKKLIREGAEKEEKEFYEYRAPQEWLDAIAPFGTDWEKPFLEEAPYLIIVFAQSYGLREDGGKKKHYYVNESVGIATGMLITSLHYAGLSTLTHTPSPMKFLNSILRRPSNEKPFLILVTGYPKENTLVPDLDKKGFEKVSSIF